MIEITQADRDLLAAEYEADAVRYNREGYSSFGMGYEIVQRALRAIAKSREQGEAEGLRRAAEFVRAHTVGVGRKSTIVERPDVFDPTVETMVDAILALIKKGTE